MDREAEILRLKREENLTFEQIGKRIGISTSSVHRLFQKALKAVAHPGVEEYRREQLRRIEMMRETILEIFETKHMMVQHGHVVKVDVPGEDGSTVSMPVRDPAPILAAMAHLVKLDEQEAKLLGLYAEKKLSVTGDVKYEVVGVNPADLA